MWAPPKYQISDRNSPLRQGEILTGVIQPKHIRFEEYSEQSSPNLRSLVYEIVEHPYAIIVSQDCDLDWDYKARDGGEFDIVRQQVQENPNDQNLKEKFQKLSSKLLNSIILCEADTASSIRKGSREKLTSNDWNLIKTQRHERYHFFQGIPLEYDFKQEGVEELTSDFKNIFSINAEFLYYQISNQIAERRTTLVSPYLEHFSNRYYNFHRRVALPEPHESIKEG